MVVGTLKISLDRLNKKKEKKEFSRVEFWAGQAVNFLKCAFILVQSKLSIPRVATNMSLA